MTVRFAVRVQPRARRERLVGWMADGVLKLAVVAPPEGGRANQAVIELLSAALGLGRGQVSIARGGSSRVKQVEVEGLGPEETRRRLDAALREMRSSDGE